MAYHDWHFGGNGDIKTFMETLATRYGEGTSLEDFERKAQMMNYETYRAVFEGLQAHMWTKNSGRLLWMTHPGLAQQPLADLQLGLRHARVVLRREEGDGTGARADEPSRLLGDGHQFHARTGATVEIDATSVFALDGRNVGCPLRCRSMPPTTSAKFRLSTSSHWSRNRHGDGHVALRDLAGKLISDNTYWQGKDDASHQLLNAMPQQRLKLSAASSRVGEEHVVAVMLENDGKIPVLAAKLTLVDHMGTRILPAIYGTTTSPCCPASPGVC